MGVQGVGAWRLCSRGKQMQRGGGCLRCPLVMKLELLPVRVWVCREGGGHRRLPLLHKDSSGHSGR